jgi:hypothetical protein
MSWRRVDAASAPDRVIAEVRDQISQAVRPLATPEVG